MKYHSLVVSPCLWGLGLRFMWVPEATQTVQILACTFVFLYISIPIMEFNFDTRHKRLAATSNKEIKQLQQYSAIKLCKCDFPS